MRALAVQLALLARLLRSRSCDVCGSQPGDQSAARDQRRHPQARGRRSFGLDRFQRAQRRDRCAARTATFKQNAVEKTKFEQEEQACGTIRSARRRSKASEAFEGQEVRHAIGTLEGLETDACGVRQHVLHVRPDHAQRATRGAGSANFGQLPERCVGDRRTQRVDQRHQPQVGLCRRDAEPRRRSGSPD